MTDTQTTETMQTLAQRYYDMLEVKRRDADGNDSFIARKDDLSETDSEELSSLCWAAHSDGDYLPDDYRYDWLHSFLGEIADTDEPEDIVPEPDIYTYDLTKWLNSNNNRISYLDSAIQEFDSDDGSKALALAQYLEMSETLGATLAWLQDKLEN